MLITDKIAETEQQTMLEKRRAFLTLSLEERRRKLDEQAEKLLVHYEREKKERESWQGGDVIEF